MTLDRPVISLFNDCAVYILDYLGAFRLEKSAYPSLVFSQTPNSNRTYQKRLCTQGSQELKSLNIYKLG